MPRLKNSGPLARSLSHDHYPAECQFDVDVADVDLNAFAGDGDLLKCLDLSAVDVDLKDGDLLLIEMGEGEDKRIHAKRLRLLGERYEFWPLAEGQGDEENVIIKNGHNHETSDFKVFAKVLWIYNAWQGDGHYSKKQNK